MKTSRYALNESNSIEVAHQGAHLCSWKCHGREQLYLSPILIEGKAIRGGVPVIFPQFEEFGDGPRHGFARTADWKKLDTDKQGLHFELNDSDESWLFMTLVTMQFELQDDSLSMSLSVKNNDDQPVQFTCALHTYFHVDDIHTVKLKGLQGLDYWTNAEDFADRKTETYDFVEFTEKTDRIYFNAQTPLELNDNARKLIIESRGFEDIVVWNPWTVDAKNMADLPDADYTKMLCIEPARVNNPVILQPGEEWQGVNRLKVFSN